MTERHSSAPLTYWRWIAAIWCAGALFDACQTVVFMSAIGRQHAVLTFATELLSWLPWMLATPAVIRLAERQPPFRGPTLSKTALHLAAFAAIGLVAQSWFSLLQMLFNPWDYPRPPSFVDAWRTSFLPQMLTFVIVYGLIIGFSFAMDARARMERQRMETARLSGELSRAQLSALRQQIEPHFMFNTLNSITGLVRDHQTDAAVGMIVGLSEFLRRALEDSHRSQVTLEEEVEYLQRYIDIQKVRFGSRLQVSIDIPADVRSARVPSLFLQPLVENAIKHGIAKRAAGGTVQVTGHVLDGKLSLRVYNEGPDLAAVEPTAGPGVGIGNLRTRLQILHGNQSGLALNHLEQGAVEVIVTLPLEEA